MELDFSGKTAIVTGGSRGIGRAIAEGMLRAGASVTVTSTEEASPWLAKYPKASHVALDFLDEGSTTRGMRQFAALPVIDILINNAGTYVSNAIGEIQDADWNRVIAVNLTAPMRMMRAIAPRMRERRRGRIVNVSSISGIIARGGGGAYAASKAGLIGFTRATALDLADANILVNILCPGTTETEMVERALSTEQKELRRNEIALKRLAQPEEIANVALFLCSDLNTYITGQTIVVDGGTIIQ